MLFAVNRLGVGDHNEKAANRPSVLRCVEHLPVVTTRIETDAHAVLPALQKLERGVVVVNNAAREGQRKSLRCRHNYWCS